jgi:hypothetical protein
MDELPNTPPTDSNDSHGIEFEAWYRDGNDDVVQPDQIVKPQSRYFWMHWVRLLGVGPASLLIRLRMACYYNPETGERRDSCWLGQDTLARDLGVGDRKTIRRWLRHLEVFDFVRRTPRMRWSDLHLRPVRTTDRYLVKTWDPPVPDHAGQALVRQAQRIIGETSDSAEKPEDSHKGQNAPLRNALPVDKSHEGQNAPRDAGAKWASKKKYLEEGSNERNVALRAPTKDGADHPGLAHVRHTLGARFKPRPTPPRKHLSDVLPHITTSPEKRDELLHIESLTALMLEQLRDSRSRPFYRLVARRFLDAGLERLVHQALSEIKDSQHSGALRNPAAVFTARIKELAQLNAIEL